MKLGFLTVSLGNMPLAEKAKWASENGFDTIEVACWPASNSRDYSSCDLDVTKLNQASADEVIRMIEGYGLSISSLAYYDNHLDADREKRARNHQHLKACIDAAAMLGVELVGTFVGRDHTKTMAENLEMFETYFTEFTAYAAKKGVKLMIENCPMTGWQVPGIPGTISYSPELWEEMFRRVPASNFGLNFDPSHLFFQMIDPVKAVAPVKARIFHVHAKDTEIFADKLQQYGTYDRAVSGGHGNGYWRYRMPGLGQINWSAFLAELKANGYDFVVSIEHEDPVYEGSEEKVKEGLKLGLAHLKSRI